MGSICSLHGPGLPREGTRPLLAEKCVSSANRGQGQGCTEGQQQLLDNGCGSSCPNPPSPFPTHQILPNHPGLPGHPPAPDPAPSASLNCLRGFASLCLIFSSTQIRAREAKREMVNCVLISVPGASRASIPPLTLHHTILLQKWDTSTEKKHQHPE